MQKKMCGASKVLTKSIFNSLLAMVLVFGSVSAHAGLADVFVEMYDKVKSGAVQPLYQSIREYIVEQRLLDFLESMQLEDPELESKYRQVITSSAFDESYFPFLLSMMDRFGVLKKVLKGSQSSEGDLKEWIKNPTHREYLRTILLIFGKLFLFKNGEEAAASEIHKQILILSKNPNLPPFVISKLDPMLKDPEAASDLYHFIGQLVKTLGMDYFVDFQRRQALRQAKLQWFAKATWQDVAMYFEQSMTKRRAVMMLVDGVGGQYMVDLLKAGKARYPSIAEMYRGGAWVDRSVSSTPTISTRNIAILETGVGVSETSVKGEQASTEIPNFTYVNRRNQEWMYFWGRDGICLRDLAKKGGAKSIFEYLDSFQTLSFMGHFDTGADERFSYFTGEVLFQFYPDLAETIGFMDLSRRSAKERNLNRKRMEVVSYIHRESQRWVNQIFWTEQHYKTLATEILETEDEGLPDFLLWYCPWVDHKTHELGPYHEKVVNQYLVKFDEDVGQLFRYYVEAGVYDQTLFGLVSDHGQIQVDLDAGVADVGASVIHPKTKFWKKISSDEGGPPKLDRSKSSIVGYDVVYGSTAGGSFVMDLFHLDAYKSPEEPTDPLTVSHLERWASHPTLMDVRSYPLFSGDRVDWVYEIKTKLKDTLDYFLVRESLPENDPSVDSCVRIIAPKGEGRILRKFSPKIWERLQKDPDFRGSREFKEAKFEKYLYQYALVSDSITGKVEGDPLGMMNQSSLVTTWVELGQWHSDEEWLQATAKLDRLDAIHEISHLYDSDLAGTLNLFPARGKGFNTHVPGRHAGELFEEKNSLQVYYGSLIPHPKKIAIARGGSMPVTLIHYLWGDEKFNDIEYNFDFKSLWRDIRKEQ